MAKFECQGTPDLVVSTESGFIQFKDYSYVTTKKIEIEALKKCKGVAEAKVTVKPKPTMIEKVVETLT